MNRRSKVHLDDFLLDFIIKRGGVMNVFEGSTIIG